VMIEDSARVLYAFSKEFVPPRGVAAVIRRELRSPTRTAVANICRGHHRRRIRDGSRANYRTAEYRRDGTILSLSSFAQLAAKFATAEADSWRKKPRLKNPASYLKTGPRPRLELTNLAGSH
jgi:hypothetical protein